MSDRPINILITGAGSGLGQGLAEHLSQGGRHLVLADLNRAALEATAQTVKRHAGTASVCELDVTRADAVAALFAQQQVDVLINNAGLQFVSPIDEFPEQKWDQLLDVMLKGSFLMCKAALPGMRQRNFGRLIHIGSIHSLVASPFKSAYIAAKHGLLGLSKTLALEAAQADITSNTVCPAYIRTPLVDAQIAAQAKANSISEAEVIDKIMLAPMPKKTFITIEEIAGTVEFLISPMARNITGQTIVMDGGWTIR